MKKIKTLREGNPIYVRRYGDEPTTLQLSELAQEIYNGTDPLDIYEADTEEGPRYYLRGAYECDGDYWTAAGMTAEELEAYFAEIDASMKDCAAWCEDEEDEEE